LARPERHDCDYFPFYAKRGKTLNILQAKYGLEGIGFFTNLMRFLTLQPDHYYHIKTDLDSMNLFAEIGVIDDIKGTEILNLLALTGKIDADLWENKVIVSEDLLKSLESAYSRRTNKIITINKIKSKCTTETSLEVSKCTTETKKNSNFNDNNPQTKLKESKVNKRTAKAEWIEPPDDDIPIPLVEEKKEAASPPAKAGYLKKITGEHFSNQVGEYLNSIIKYAGTISTLNNKHPPFNPYKFTQFHIKQKTHPGALMETLEAISKQWDQIQNPWSYGTAVIKTKNGNWYEKEEIKKYQEVEQEWNGILKENPRLSALISEAMKGI